VITAASATFAVLALLAGVPLGIVAGRSGWAAVADNLFIARAAQIPVLATVSIAIGLLGFATLLSLVPARVTVRPAPGQALRTE
jgi:hypothetical protein